MTYDLVGSFYRNNLSGFLNIFSFFHLWKQVKKGNKKTRQTIPPVPHTDLNFYLHRKHCLCLVSHIKKNNFDVNTRENYFDHTFKIDEKKEKILTHPSGLPCLVLSLQLNDISYIFTFSGQVSKTVVETSYPIVISKPLYNTYENTPYHPNLNPPPVTLNSDALNLNLFWMNNSV